MDFFQDFLDLFSSEPSERGKLRKKELADRVLKLKEDNERLKESDTALRKEIDEVKKALKYTAADRDKLQADNERLKENDAALRKEIEKLQQRSNSPILKPLLIILVLLISGGLAYVYRQNIQQEDLAGRMQVDNERLQEESKQLWKKNDELQKEKMSYKKATRLRVVYAGYRRTMND